MSLSTPQSLAVVRHTSPTSFFFDQALQQLRVEHTKNSGVLFASKEGQLRGVIVSCVSSRLLSLANAGFASIDLCFVMCMSTDTRAILQDQWPSSFLTILSASMLKMSQTPAIGSSGADDLAEKAVLLAKVTKMKSSVSNITTLFQIAARALNCDALKTLQKMFLSVHSSHTTGVDRNSLWVTACKLGFLELVAWWSLSETTWCPPIDKMRHTLEDLISRLRLSESHPTNTTKDMYVIMILVASDSSVARRSCSGTQEIYDVYQKKVYRFIKTPQDKRATLGVDTALCKLPHSLSEMILVLSGQHYQNKATVGWDTLALIHNNVSPHWNPFARGIEASRALRRSLCSSQNVQNLSMFGVEFLGVHKLSQISLSCVPEKKSDARETQEMTPVSMSQLWFGYLDCNGHCAADLLTNLHLQTLVHLIATH
jgi:hypothetical protein